MPLKISVEKDFKYKEYQINHIFYSVQMFPEIVIQTIFST